MIAKSKIVVDLDASLVSQFDRVVSDFGHTKTYVIGNLIRNYLLEYESAPRNFPRKRTPEIHPSAVTTRRTRKDHSRGAQ